MAYLHTTYYFGTKPVIFPHILSKNCINFLVKFEAIDQNKKIIKALAKTGYKFSTDLTNVLLVGAPLNKPTKNNSISARIKLNNTPATIVIKR